MKSILRIYWVLSVTFGMTIGYGQEDSAELFTEAYSDQFQEAFFEALKQKGIENYDRAESLLLKAKNLDSLNPDVDYELGRVLFLNREYNRAEQYALQALRARPEEYWFLVTFMEILDKQSKPLDSYKASLPIEMQEFRTNLVRWYLRSGKWDLAETYLEGLPNNDEVGFLREKIIRNRNIKPKVPDLKVSKNTGPEAEEGSVTDYNNRLATLLSKENWALMEQLSSEALEIYPLQPYFHYVNGLALLRRNRPKDAVEILVEGESLLLEDNQVAQNIFKALVEAFAILGETEKANKYRNKLKPGS